MHYRLAATQCGQYIGYTRYNHSRTFCHEGRVSNNVHSLLFELQVYTGMNLCRFKVLHIHGATLPTPAPEATDAFTADAPSRLYEYGTFKVDTFVILFVLVPVKMFPDSLI